MTCATLVEVIFRSAGLELVKVEEWSRPSEQRAREDRDQMVRLAALADIEVGAWPSRLRPEEIAAASGKGGVPLGLVEAEAAAEELREALLKP